MNNDLPERGSSFWSEVLQRLARHPPALLPFEEVRTRLRLRPGLFRGLQRIPLDRIIGSVGRYRDFTRAFLPRRIDERWRLINQAWERGESLPPIEVYQVGEVYFVSDGNHRVSVARAHGATDIDAYVTEFQSLVPLSPETDIDDLLLKEEQAAFIERTRLQALRPQARIDLTVPDGYRQLLEHIETHRYFLGQEQSRAVGSDEAVMSWYDNVYMPIVQAIRRHRVLERFPGRTEGDLYLWISRHHWELRERYGTYTVDADLAAADFVAYYAPTPASTARRLARGALERIGGLVQRLLPPTTALPIVVPVSIGRVNTLPATWRRRIYRLTLPSDLLAAYDIDPVTLAGADGRPAMLFDDAPGSQVTTITCVVGGCEDPLISLGLADDSQGHLHLTHLVSYRPDSARYAIDRAPDGRPLPDGVRHREAEAEARTAGLAPGQPRTPTDVHAKALGHIELLAAVLDHPLFVASPRYYHEAIFLERAGFAYSWGEAWMRQIDQRFRSSGLAARLDGSTPFRQPDAAMTIRGRSWAIYDGVLEEAWPQIWMYKQVGRHARIDTFADGTW
jgi:hypothetical protein